MNDAARFRLKLKDVEFEVEGPQEWVERQLDQVLPRVLGSASQAPETPMEHSEPPVLRVRRRIDLDDFIKLKNPATSVEVLLALAYFIERYEKKSDYYAEELEKRWPEGQGAGWDREMLAHCVASGYLTETASGTFTLTYSGEQYVQGGF